MKTHPSLKVIVIACIGALASCATPVKTTRMPVSASFHPDNSLTGQLLKEANDYRRSHGASPLARHAGLDRLAQQHCEYLRAHRGTFSLYGKNVSHFGFEGRSMFAREQYQMGAVSENVASANNPGKNPAPVLIKLWSESDGHNKNLLNDWTYTGVGIVVDSDGTVFSTQLFATVGSSQSNMHRRLTGF